MRTRTDRLDVRRAYERVLEAGTTRSDEIEVGGDRVHVLEKGAGPSLVLLHGGALTAGSFMPLLDQLQNVRALAIDRPGHGLSEPIALPRRRLQEGVVAWLDQLLDDLGLDSTAMLGHSGGARWALWYALARPERVSRLVLLGPPGVAGTRAPLPVRMIATPGLGELLSRAAPPTRDSMLRFAGFMGEKATLGRYPEQVDLMVAAGRDRDIDRVGREEIRALAPAFALLTPSGFRRSARVGARELGEVETPTLLVWGEWEPLGDVTVAKRAANWLPNGRLFVVRGGHAPWLGEPERVASAAAEFVLSGEVTRPV